MVIRAAADPVVATCRYGGGGQAWVRANIPFPPRLLGGSKRRRSGRRLTAVTLADVRGKREGPYPLIGGVPSPSLYPIARA